MLMCKEDLVGACNGSCSPSNYNRDSIIDMSIGKVSVTGSTVSWVKWLREPNIYYDYAVLLLVSLLLHALINATRAGTRLYI